MKMDTTERCGAAAMVILIGILVFISYGAIKESIKADKKYCMEQMRYEYNDCIVKIQG
jgi:hypothetical protein